jgi:hypothetical protein
MKIFALLAVLACLIGPFSVKASSLEDMPTIVPRPTTEPPVKVEAVKLDGAPEVDGRGLEWEEVPEAVAPLWPTVKRDPDNHLGPVDLRIKAGVFEETLYLMLHWPDPLPNATHLSWVWDFTMNRYFPGTDLEDRLALRFALDDKFSACPLAGSPQGADLWLWRAARTNPVGYALNAFHLVSASSLTDGRPWKLPDGEVRWLAIRPDQGGDDFTYTLSYDSYRGDIVPRYIVNKAEKLSAIQKRIVAKGIWLEGFWTLELARAFDSEVPADVVFRPGTVFEMSVSAANRGEGAHESVSPLIKLIIPHSEEIQTAHN